MTKNQYKPKTILIPQECIESKILFIRGKKVMLDRELAKLYGVSTGHLKRAVNRNIERFPHDFMFKLNKDEVEILRCQIGISKKGRGGSRYLSYAFTQEGVAMLSSVLNSERSVFVNIQIMRTFVKLRELMLSHKDLSEKIESLERKFNEHDKNFVIVFEAIKKLLEPTVQRKKPIGFHP
ncbi:MAG: ORF6N domain-containing protein [Candidatus Omnitrophica bacterium]|nr:ORF6N domain-containing protein [Candidatus Omnitrophota bacterium]